MNSKFGEELRNELESAAMIDEADKHFRVEREQIRRVDAAASIVNFPGPENRGLLQIESPIQIPHRRKWSLAALSGASPIGIDPPRVSVNDIRLSGFERRRNRVQSSGTVEIVGIQICQDVSGRVTKSLGDGIRCAGIFFRYPIGQALIVSPDDFDGIVGRAAINHDVFQIGVILRQHRLHREIDEAALVVRGRDDADSRKVHKVVRTPG